MYVRCATCSGTRRTVRWERAPALGAEETLHLQGAATNCDKFRERRRRDDREDAVFLKKRGYVTPIFARRLEKCPEIRAEMC